MKILSDIGELWNAGKTAPELADRYGVTVRAVHKRLRQLRKAGRLLRCGCSGKGATCLRFQRLGFRPDHRQFKQRRLFAI